MKVDPAQTGDLVKVVTTLEKSPPKEKRSAFERANFLSKLGFYYVSHLVWKGRRGHLSDDHLDLPSDVGADRCTEKFLKHWEAELKLAEKQDPKDPPSLLRALKKCYLKDLIIAGIFKFFWAVFILTAAFLFVKLLLEFAQDYQKQMEALQKTNPGELPPKKPAGWILACMMFVDCVLLSICLQQMNARSSKIGIQVRSTLVTAVFRKSLKLREINISTGDIVNLCAVDCNKLLEGCTNIHYLWSGPLEAIAICCLIASVLKLAVLPGVGLLLLIVPIQFLIGKKVTQLRMKTIEVTDSRVQSMNEILMAAKIVKYCCWESFFDKSVSQIRESELVFLKKAAVYKSINLMIVFIIPPAMAVLMFSTYVMNPEGTTLVASVSFTVLSMFNTLRFPLVVFPKALKNFVESLASLDRIQAFLLKPERDLLPTLPNGEIGASMEDADIGYDEAGAPILKDVTFKLPQGKLMGIAGAVGSGKSTLMVGVLGQAFLLKGKAAVGGKVAYVPQTPWIQNATVRENILFGKPLDEAWYRQVLYACALETDLRIFINGDLEEIGERGANLSGGQRQRIALARAVYSKADIYILDAPLSAVDQHTSNHIFRHCIKTLLKGKTVLMSTHKIYLLAQSDLVGIIKDSRLAFFGPYEKGPVRRLLDELEAAEDEDAIGGFDAEENRLEELAAAAEKLHIQSDRRLSIMHHRSPSMSPAKPSKASKSRPTVEFKDIKIHDVSDNESNSRKGKAETTADKEASSALSQALKEIRDEAGVKGGWPAYKAWARSCGYWLAFAAFMAHPITQVIRILNDYWLTAWTKDQFGLGAYNQEYYMWTQALWVVAFGVALICRGLLFYYAALKAATVLHQRLFANVLRAPWRFFVLTPLARVLTCFSQHQDIVDETLPDTFHLTIVYLMILLTTVIAVCVNIPWFVIPAVSLLAAFLVMLYLYIPTARALRTFYSQSSSKLFAHLGETLVGMNVVRAFNAEERFIQQNVVKTDDNHAAQFTFNSVQGWLSFRLDLMGALLVLCVALMCIGLLDQYKATIIGFSISQIFQAFIFFSWVVKGVAEIDSLITSVAQIDYYGSSIIPEGPLLVENNRPPKDWPPKGQVTYKDVVLSYLPGQKPALRGVSFDIMPGEKVGIVGRTGSGKSTLLMALFRLVESTSGSIVIDSLNVGGIGMDDLRSRLSIIPQEPVMFKGTVRSNLDPLGEYNDAELWNSLEITNLKHYVESLPLKLDEPVTEGGSNWSLGFKQLACLCRVVLKNSQILVLDEATAAVDPKTEGLVCTTIREHFARTTVLTIAHRLDTIIDSDKILFMDQGTVLEFDSPYNLLADPSSHFAKLVSEAGLAAEKLRCKAVRHESRILMRTLSNSGPSFIHGSPSKSRLSAQGSGQATVQVHDLSGHHSSEQGSVVRLDPSNPELEL